LSFQLLLSTQVAVLPKRYDAEMGTVNSLHALAKYGEYLVLVFRKEKKKLDTW